MAEHMRVVLAGLSGYGEFYLGYFLDRSDTGARLVAGIDPRPERCPRLDALRTAGIPVHPSLGDFFASGGTADLVIISSPIHHHAPQVIAALEHGCHVLCEKPLCATLQEGRAMLAAQRSSGLSVTIGYQWSFSEAVQQLKKDIMAGLFGMPRRAKSLVLWPRDHAYYARNCWAGRMRTGSGVLVLDSPLNNATSHFLHNMLYLLGPSLDRSAEVAQVEAELYRANDIENYDTAAVRVTLAGGTPLLFITSHATRDSRGPALEMDFELAQLSQAQAGSDIIAEFSSGVVWRYGSPDADPHRKIALTLDAIRTGAQPLCSIETAMAQTVVMNAAQQAAPVVDFDDALVCSEEGEGAPRLWVEGLGQELERCYDESRLPSELGLAWARAAHSFDTHGYDTFAGPANTTKTGT